MRDNDVRQRLLAKDKPALSACVKECRVERAKKTHLNKQGLHRQLKTEPLDVDLGDKLLCTTTTHTENRLQLHVGTCRFCNRRHEKGKCPAYGLQCRNCGKRNHFAAVCRQRQSAHMITHDSFDALSVTLDGDDGRSDVVVNRVHPTKAATLNAVYAMIRIRDVVVRFQIDSGATCNVLRLEDLSLLGHVALSATERSLRMYDSSLRKPVGTCQSHCAEPQNRRVMRLRLHGGQKSSSCSSGLCR